MNESTLALINRIRELELALEKEQLRLAFLTKKAFRVNAQWGYADSHWKVYFELPPNVPAGTEISKDFIKAVDQCLSLDLYRKP